MKNKTKSKEVTQVTGYGVVGTWVTPRGKLGGTLPRYLNNREDSALTEAENNERLLEFYDNTQVYLCEITIKPIREVTKAQKVIFE